VGAQLSGIPSSSNQQQTCAQTNSKLDMLQI
jgi:hypothetical protein